MRFPFPATTGLWLLQTSVWQGPVRSHDNPVVAANGRPMTPWPHKVHTGSSHFL
jgi:hypothetical protein